MTLIPDEELNPKPSFNLAPMVDFLFLVLAIFAVLAVTRSSLFDTEITLAKLTPEKNRDEANDFRYTVALSVNPEGQYKWIAEMSEIMIESAEEVQKQLSLQQELGLLPRDNEKIKVLLHIDREARWEKIVDLIFKVRELGMQINPIYEPLETTSSL